LSPLNAYSPPLGLVPPQRDRAGFPPPKLPAFATFFFFSPHCEPSFPPPLGSPDPRRLISLDLDFFYFFLRCTTEWARTYYLDSLGMNLPPLDEVGFGGGLSSAVLLSLKEFRLLFLGELSFFWILSSRVICVALPCPPSFPRFIFVGKSKWRVSFISEFVALPGGPSALARPHFFFCRLRLVFSPFSRRLVVVAFPEHKRLSLTSPGFLFASPSTCVRDPPRVLFQQILFLTFYLCPLNFLFLTPLIGPCFLSPE